MTGPYISGHPHIEGFEAPMHRALAEPILLGGAPRVIAIVNGTVAAALGLGLGQRTRRDTGGWSLGDGEREENQHAAFIARTR